MSYAPLHEHTHTVDEAFALGFLSAYLTAWNSRTPANLLALATDDVVWEDPTIPGGRAEGHAAVAAWLTSFWHSFPDMTFAYLDAESHDGPEAMALSRGGKSLIAPWRCRGTWLGPIVPPGLAPNGAKVDLVGVDLYAFRDGKVCHVRTITDLQASLRQMGLAPASGGMIERVGVSIQRVVARATKPT